MMSSHTVGILTTVCLLILSNLMMTFAWYWHLRAEKPGASNLNVLWIILISWLIAGLEYCLAVPANRLGAAHGLRVAQLKIIQEVITVGVFIPFVIFFMGEKWRWDYLWALLCMVGAVYFVNRNAL